MMRARVAAMLLLGCTQRGPDATPEGALDAFLSACESVSSDPRAPAKAFALIAPSARAALTDRARRSAAITGKSVAPEQLLVLGWSPIRFEIAKTTTRIEGGGATASVDVYGVDPATQHAVVPMEREGDAWRVRLTLPSASAEPASAEPAAQPAK